MKAVMWDEIFVISTQLNWFQYLDERFKLTSTDIRMRCCHNHWIKCCKIYPWQGQAMIANKSLRDPPVVAVVGWVAEIWSPCTLTQKNERNTNRNTMTLTTEIDV